MRIAATADLHFSPERYAKLKDQLDRVRDEADVFVLAGDLTNFGQPSEMEPLLNVLVRLRLPTVYGYREFVEAGGLMSYGTDHAAQWRRGAEIVDLVLKGAKPADIPVEQPTKFELVVNLKTAKASGFTVPTMVMISADEVIE